MDSWFTGDHRPVANLLTETAEARSTPDVLIFPVCPFLRFWTVHQSCCARSLLGCLAAFLVAMLLWEYDPYLQPRKSAAALQFDVYAIATFPETHTSALDALMNMKLPGRSMQRRLSQRFLAVVHNADRLMIKAKPARWARFGAMQHVPRCVPGCRAAALLSPGGTPCLRGAVLLKQSSMYAGSTCTCSVLFSFWAWKHEESQVVVLCGACCHR